MLARPPAASAAASASFSSYPQQPGAGVPVPVTASPPPPQSSPSRDLVDKIATLPWQRMLIWAGVVWAAYQLRDFFGIFMGTFVVSFIGVGFVNSAMSSPVLRGRLSPVSRRRAFVLAFFGVIVCAVAAFGVGTIPDLVREGADFVRRLKSDNIWVVVLEKIRAGLGDGVMDQVERLLLVASGDELVSAGLAAGGAGSSSAAAARAAAAARSHFASWTPDRTAYLGAVLQRMLRSYTETAITVTSALVSSVSRFALQVGVSLVLAFMVVWDVDTIAAGVRSLASSRLAPVYAEVAPPLSVFGQLFGKALQAQARIAAVNTGLTAAGMAALAIPGAGLLSLFVFLCSFIPIAGCFISTVPIAFVALTEYGFIKLALVVLMVACIHVIEAYGLNPAIYSAHLKLHPLLVLAVLVVAEHSLGVWGLLLAVPATVFVLDYAIRYPACSVVGVAARELQTMEDSDSEGDGSGGEREGGRARVKRGGGGGGGGEGGGGPEGGGPGGGDGDGAAHGGWAPPRPTLGDLRQQR